MNQMNGRSTTVSVEQMVMTPALAEEWIARDESIRSMDGTRRRPVVDTRVISYASAMSRGEWAINGETVSLSPYGHLLNGNHRLRAVVRSGCAVPVLVVRGVDPSTFGTMDQGVKRTTAHVAAIAGIKHASLVSAAARLVMLYQETGLPLSAPHVVHSSQSVVSFILESRADWEESATACLSAFKIVRPALLVAWHWLAGEMPDERSLFLEDLISGQNLNATRPVYLFRERMIKGQSGSAKLVTKAQAALLFKAWNAEVSGESMKMLKWSTDHEFPTMVGARVRPIVAVAD